MILPIALTTAGAAALVNMWLASRVGRVRIAEKVSVGDGGNPRLIARMRAHLNFAEYAPVILILIALVELAKGSQFWLWVVALVFILGRVAHGIGMDGRMPLRQFGMASSSLIMVGLGLYAAAIPYLKAYGL